MTSKEFESYACGIAYHAIKFERGKINAEELLEALRVQLGDEIFEEAKKIMDKK